MRTLYLSLLLFLCSCTQLGLAALNLPTAFDNETIVHDVAYGPDPEQKLDIYVPGDVAKQPRDVIVFFYGGRWTSGAKEDYRFVGTTLADQGFVVVIPDYRKYPNVHFPIFIEDGAKALAWTYDNINQYSGASDRIHVAGHSAGAHIGALLTADAEYLEHEGKKRSDVIRSFVGLAGPYDFTPDEPDLEDMFGPPSNYSQMQVTTFIDGKQPPMLLLQGATDTVVKRSNLDKLQKQIDEKGGIVKSIIYPNTDHIQIILGLSWNKSSDAPVLTDLVDFFHATDQSPRTETAQ